MTSKATYRIEPAFTVAPGLSRKLVLAGKDIENQWFFSDGALTENGIIDHQPNTWLNENFVVLDDNGIIAYFCATWSRPLDIISGFRLILFEKEKSTIMVKAFFEYLDYLFVNRGCNAWNKRKTLWNINCNSSNSLCNQHDFCQNLPFILFQLFQNNESEC